MLATSLFLAKLLGLYGVIVTAGVLLNQKSYQKVIEDLLKNAALVYLGGIFALFFGLLLVLFHNVWVLGWPVIITIMGWLGLLKGVWIIVFPESFAKAVTYHINNPQVMKLRLYVFLFLSVVLLVFGFWVR